MRFQLIQGEWFRALMSRFAASGVTDVVVSPGSRSTPLVAAAHREPRLTVHAVADERSASFFALGLARATGRPPVLIRTSGTASAHDFPAVIEASEDHVPLIVVSADRPFELQASGAPQTMDQRSLFGRFVRFDLELGLPDLAGLSGLDRGAARAVHRASSPVPGPVHVNARARKPLEPTAPETPEEDQVRATVDRLSTEPRSMTSALRGFEPAALRAVAEVIRGAASGALIAGPLSPSRDGDEALRAAAAAFLSASGFRLWAEASSQLRVRELAPDDAFEWDQAEAPDVAVLLGRYPSSRVLQERLRASRRLVTVHPFAPADPDGRAAHVFEGPVIGWLHAAAVALGREDDVAASVRARSSGSPPSPADASQTVPAPSDATERRLARSAETWSRVDAALAKAPLVEAHVVRAVVASTPEEGALVVANSLAIRLFDRFVPGFRRPVPIFTQRGVNGIDGAVSSAAGVASGRSAPTAAVLGDVAFLHDIGGLAVAATVNAPLPLVVIDNGGGRIFEELPLVKTVEDPSLVALFTTPHRHRLAAAGAVFGVPACKVNDQGALEAALDEAWSRSGPTLIHVVVSDRGREVQAELRGGPQ